MDGELIGELARRSNQKFEKSVKLLHYNIHICYVSDVNSFFKSLRSSTCDTIFSKTGILEQHLIICSERVRHIYPKKVYQFKKHFLKSYILSMFHTERIKSCLKTWPFLISIIFALWRRRIKKLKLHNGLENMSLYQFHFRQT